MNKIPDHGFLSRLYTDKVEYAGLLFNPTISDLCTALMLISTAGITTHLSIRMSCIFLYAPDESSGFVASFFQPRSIKESTVALLKRERLKSGFSSDLYKPKNQSEGEESVGHHAIEIIFGAVFIFLALSQFAVHSPGFITSFIPVFLKLSNNINDVSLYSSDVET